MQRRQKQIQPTDLKMKPSGPSCENSVSGQATLKSASAASAASTEHTSAGREGIIKPDGGAAVADCRRAGNPAESARETNGTLDADQVPSRRGDAKRI